ncbi:uncharacterized protein LOC120277951 isoform X2 [Dioscorea cayenensis subsp. rotundata]|uniref:Uncharacterized protein LOC120277951 isoform X2 n=1 Tax=Dioscorea cayennensis subsp. rotundata TaxID=55577 RepID=A0AB40CLK2_DIOCR|nr:uncharacterized protein LOC120277951 isoform X2 [Dioscorea cayenensis subsp. rotundata]
MIVLHFLASKIESSSTFCSRQQTFFSASIGHIRGQKVQHCKERKGKEKRIASATNDNSTSDKQNAQQESNRKYTGHTDVASKVKQKRVSFRTLRGAHTGAVIVGREVPHSSSFLTASDLMALRNRRFASRRTKNEETNHQACRTIEAPNISTTQQEALEILATQQSMTTTESKETPQMSSVKATQESMITEHVIS